MIENMSKATIGDTVKVSYLAKYTDGQEFDSTDEDDPYEFTIGESQVIPGFEEAITGMGVGESKSVRIPADKAYGPMQEDLVVKLDKSSLPEDVEPAIGLVIGFQDDEGDEFEAEVIKITDDTVVLDANHPLAGEDLDFEITLEEIVSSK